MAEERSGVYLSDEEARRLQGSIDTINSILSSGSTASASRPVQNASLASTGKWYCVSSYNVISLKLGICLQWVGLLKIPLYIHV